jgi:pimeloyl-ACP methyl ester carboxylesterase
MEYKENRYRSAEGLELYYREYGHGSQAIVCLPGLSRNSKDFHELALHLASGYRVICPDLRGRGQSQHDPNSRNYNIIVYTQDLQQLMEVAGLQKPILIGTSLGGFIAMTMAYLVPARLRAIVLNDAGPEVDPAGIKRILGYAGAQTPPRNWQEAALQVKANYGSALTGMPESFWAEHARLSYVENEAGVPVLEIDGKIFSSLKSANRVGKILKFLNSIGLVKKVRGIPVDAWESFRAVSMPCLVLRGAKSDILSEATVARMRAIKKDLAVATIPNRGHAPLLDEPESLAAIDSFLESLADQGKPG